MNTTLFRPVFFLVLVASLFDGLPLSAASKKGPPKDPGIRGVINAVTTGTPASLTVDKKEIQVDETTTITLEGRPVKLKEIKPGLFAQVSTYTLGDKLTAVSVRVSTKAPADDGTRKKKKKGN